MDPETGEADEAPVCTSHPISRCPPGEGWAHVKYNNAQAAAGIGVFSASATFGNDLKVVSVTGASNFTISQEDITSVCASRTNSDGSACEEAVEVTGVDGPVSAQPQLLFTVAVRVRTNIAASTAAVRTQVGLLRDNDGGSIRSAGQGSTVDRTGPKVRGDGTVHLLAEASVGSLVAYPLRATLFNVAALGGSSAAATSSSATSVVAVAVYPNPALRLLQDVSSMATCTSTSSAVAVSAGCSVAGAVGTGAFGAGASAAPLEVAFGGLSTDAAVDVWQPTAPAAVATSVSTLRQIEGTDCGGSSVVYQAARVRITADFSLGGTGASEIASVDITDMLLADLVVSNAAVLSLNNERHTLVAKQAGTATVSLPNVGGAATSNTVTVTVDDSLPVSAFSLSLTPYSGVGLVLDARRVGADGTSASSWAHHSECEVVLQLAQSTRQVVRVQLVVAKREEETARTLRHHVVCRCLAVGPRHVSNELEDRVALLARIHHKGGGGIGRRRRSSCGSGRGAGCG